MRAISLGARWSGPNPTSAATARAFKVLIADKDKALENIGRILGAFDDKLRVDLEGKVAALKLTTSDPAAAAEAYAKMIKGT